MSSDDRDLQAKLQPVVECINRTFAHYEELRPDYRKRIAQITSPSTDIRNGFPTFVSFKVAPFEQNAQFRRDCADGLKKAAGMSPKVADIDAPANDAASALLALLQPGDDMEAYIEQKAYLNDNFARGRQLDATVGPLLDRIVEDGTKLQVAVQRQEASLHQHELDAIEKKYGRNLTWHTRNTMMAARRMNDSIVGLANNRRLDAASVAEAEKPMQTAYDDGAAWVRAHPNASTPNANGGTPMWFHVNDNFSRELGYTNELRQALNNPKTEQSTIASDVNTITSDFNSMIQTYNLMEQNNISTD